jgi:hypothetical protein
MSHCWLSPEEHAQKRADPGVMKFNVNPTLHAASAGVPAGGVRTLRGANPTDADAIATQNEQE